MKPARSHAGFLIAAEVSAVLMLTAMTVYSAVLVKEAAVPPALVSVRRIPSPTPAPPPIPAPRAVRPPMIIAQRFIVDPGFDATRIYEFRADRIERAFERRLGRLTAVPLPVVFEDVPEPIRREPIPTTVVADTDARWFDGRMITPSRTIRMRVTAYSPDSQSCGEYADGMTATLHSVWTNGMNLAAADTGVLPYGSMISVPGYDAGRVVPVLDCGGAIKGHRLDVLFAEHEQALQWGVRELDVVVWAFADGSPIDNPRERR